MDYFRVFGGKRKFQVMMVIAAFYTALSLAYSLIGFLYYQPGSHYHEYEFTKLAIEIGGHYLFGFIAALPLMDLDIALLTGALAILIDIDHVLSAVGYSVSGRPDHSVLYLIVSTSFILYLGTKLRLSNELLAKLLFVGPITLLAHLSYDVFTAGGTTFQILIPFSYQEFFFSDWTWIVFESGAIVLALTGLILSRSFSRKAKKSTSHASTPVVQPFSK
ncbi:MAG TPA: hypothetical protein VN739_00215 [Nitrososphaerales archaeon]|nr:hypothetical protein [Nitrososphaerales archaeon]